MAAEWFLYNGLTKEQFQNLDLNGLRNELLKFTLKDVDQLFVWTEEFTDWKLLKSTTELHSIFDECFTQRFQKKAPPPLPSIGPKAKLPPAVPEMKIESEVEKSTSAKNKAKPVANLAPSAGANNPDSNLQKEQNLDLAVSKDMKSLNFVEQRQFPRYPLKLKVLIRSKEITFRTFTDNISLGGVALEHPIPDILLQQTCEILIAGDQNAENIRFNLKIVNQKQGKRLQFVDDVNSAGKLKTWIEDYLVKHPVDPIPKSRKAV